MPSAIVPPTRDNLADYPSQIADALIRAATAAKRELDMQRPVGVALTDADQTLTIGGGAWYQQSVALTANRVKTLSTAGAVAGDSIDITRTTTAEFTLTIVNGGAGAGNLFVMASSKLGHAQCVFDGTNWVLKSLGVQ